MKWSTFGNFSNSYLYEIAPQFEWALIQFEFFLAAWLLLGWLPRVSSLIALTVFSAFAGVSLVMTLQGRSSCGCLGQVNVSPALILAFDIVFVLLLVVSRAYLVQLQRDAHIRSSRIRNLGIAYGQTMTSEG